MSKRNTCTMAHPYNKAADVDKQMWSHPSAKSVYDGDDYERFECPVCGLRFKVEIAQ